MNQVSKRFLVITLALAVLGIYLFVSAPAAIPDQGGAGTDKLPVAKLFQVLDSENAITRNLYTSEIVGEGLKRGLKFGEDWKRKEVHAGPLPALLLRETANFLQAKSPDLSLFLGSDFPIVSANLFAGLQKTHFEKVRKDGKPQLFVDPSTKRHTAMFADIASAKPCVTCHNEHDKSPKKDWALNEIMGATTWQYTKDHLSHAQLMGFVSAYRKSALEAYGSYLTKVRQFPEDKRPQIGKKWPREGFFLPDEATFALAVERETSAVTMRTLLASNEPTQ